MTYSNARQIPLDQRSEERHEVYHRTRATAPDGHNLSLLLVNVSPAGMMARSDDILVPGDLIKLNLPIVGAVRAEIRWALGGRTGCRFAAPIGHDTYAEMLAAMNRG